MFKQRAYSLHDLILDLEEKRNNHRSDLSEEDLVHLSLVTSVERMRSMAQDITARASRFSFSQRVMGFVDGRLLGKAFEEYSNQAMEQKKRGQDGSLINKIAAAVQRMPAITRLELLEKPVPETVWGCHGRSAVASTWQAELTPKSIIFPLAREDSKSRYNGQTLGKPPIDLLVKLPVALYRAGVSIQNLDIKVTAAAKWSTESTKTFK